MVGSDIWPHEIWQSKIMGYIKKTKKKLKGKQRMSITSGKKNKSVKIMLKFNWQGFTAKVIKRKYLNNNIWNENLVRKFYNK